MRRVTVIRPGALGDTLLSLPALALLRAWAPDARLTLVARGDTLSLAVASGLADEAWSWDLPDWSALYTPGATVEALSPRAREALAGADVVVAWLPDADGTLAANLQRLGVGRTVIAPGRPPAGSGAHAALWLAGTLAPLGVRAPQEGVGEAARMALWRALPPLRWPEADDAAARQVWETLGLAAGAGVVALHPGSGGAAKRWPAEGFAAVAARAHEAGMAALLLAGEADVGAAGDVRVALAQSTVDGWEIPVARGLSVGALAALLRRCAGYVGNDSGVSHLAGLLGLPTVAVFGPTAPEEWAPLGPRVYALRAPEGDLARLAAETVWETLRAAMAAGG